MDIDELNQLVRDEGFDIESYFDEMDLTKEEKEERKDFAKEMQDVLLFIFALYLTMKKYGKANKEYIEKQFESKYLDVAKKYTDIDEYLSGLIRDSTVNIVDTTFRHDGEDYFTSEEREDLIACNSANDTLNYKQYAEAIKTGKKNKRWITEKDNRVRKAHKRLDNMVLPINEPFVVGETLMRFPHDTMYGVDYEQLSNCRCTVKYF